MVANIIICTFLVWFTKGKYVFLGFIAMTVMIINGCAKAPKQSFPHIPPQLEIERFERATALSYSEIPEVYDISHLRVGSMAKFRVKHKNVVIGRPYYAVYIVRCITSNPPENKFIFDIESYGGTVTTLSNKGFTYSKIMQGMNLEYTIWFNRKNGKVGQGRGLIENIFVRIETERSRR